MTPTAEEAHGSEKQVRESQKEQRLIRYATLPKRVGNKPMDCPWDRNSNPTETYQQNGFVRGSPLLLRRMSLSAHFPSEVDKPNSLAFPSELQDQVMDGRGSVFVRKYHSHFLWEI